MNAQESSPSDAVRPLLRARQTREFTDAPIDQAALDAIADAARWSGSSQNKQPWRFIVVQDRETLRGLGEAGGSSTRSLLTAPAAIVITMPDDKERAISRAYDEGRAAERILVAATMLGLAAGIAWCGADARPRVAELLGLPADRTVRTIVAIGHPSEQGRRRKSPPGEARLPREETVFAERWPS